MNKPVLCPLDGRYASCVDVLAECMGETALAQARVRVECAYFERLCSLRLAGLTPLSEKETQFLRALPALTQSDLQALSAYEFTGRKGIAATNHDVKALEYFIKEKLSDSSLNARREWIHFALTSEDVNSVAYALLLSDGVEKVLLVSLEKIYKQLVSLSRRQAGALMLARTHGQAAVPTTFGKEICVFADRLARQIKELKTRFISCKFGGAVGNYNAHYAAFPSVNWPKNARVFINQLNKGRKIKLFLTPCSTQVDPRDSYAELFDNLRRVDVILLDFCQDMWHYISVGLVAQKKVNAEVGSSTMPQKVNPICFENAEGNLGLANALFSFFSQKLPVSRLQRDLSDSTVLRNMAVSFGYAEVAYQSILKGLSRIAFDEKAALAELDAHPEVIAEGLQTILRARGVNNPYEEVKKWTRGRHITSEILNDFINQVPVDGGTKKKLLALRVRQYAGIAKRLAGGK